MTNEEMARIQSELVTYLLEVSRFHMSDILNRYSPQSETDILNIKKSLWSAREVLRREHGVCFGKVPRASGLFDRIGPKQLASQARRQRQAGGRKIARALERTDLAAKTSPPEERERLEKEADRQRLRIALSRRRVALPGLDAD